MSACAKLGVCTSAWDLRTGCNYTGFNVIVKTKTPAAIIHGSHPVAKSNCALFNAAAREPLDVHAFAEPAVFG